MSKKTIKQRIAVVAVSALTAGVFSVVSTPIANSATADVVASSLWIATTNSATVDPVVTALGGDTDLDKSKGYLAVTSANVGGAQAIDGSGTGLLGGTTGTAVALQSSKLVFNAAGGAASERVSLVATNGTVSGVTAARFNITQVATTDTGDIVTITTTGAHGLAIGDRIVVDAQLAIADTGAGGQLVASTADATTFTYVNGAGVNANTVAQNDTGNVSVASTFNGNATAAVRNNGQNPVVAGIVTPNAGATTMTVSAYKGASVSATLPTEGTLLGSWVITLSASAATGDFSAARSAVAVTTAFGDATITTSVDASTGNIAAGNPYFIQMIANNAYAQPVTSGSFVATATNGALLNWGALAAAGGVGSATAAGSLSTAILNTGLDGSHQLRVDPASSLTTSTTTVTITHNGTPVTTKTLTFYGEAKKIVIESVKSGRTGTAIGGGLNGATAYAVYSYRDSADGKVPGGAATFSALSATPIISTGVSVRAPSRSTQAVIASGDFNDAVETSIGTGQDGVFAFTCLTTSGATSVTISHTNAISLASLSAPVAISCNGGFATYTVSTDKASYAVGEIATITIDAKDSSGNAVSENTALPVTSVSVGGGALTAAIAGTELFTAGKRTVQAQMTTAGTFNLVVTIAGSVTSTATARYAITDGAVSNAQVLQSIVALIASINKQIAALQKLILKR